MQGNSRYRMASLLEAIQIFLAERRSLNTIYSWMKIKRRAKNKTENAVSPLLRKALYKETAFAKHSYQGPLIAPAEAHQSRWVSKSPNEYEKPYQFHNSNILDRFNKLEERTKMRAQLRKKAGGTVDSPSISSSNNVNLGYINNILEKRGFRAAQRVPKREGVRQWAKVQPKPTSSQVNLRSSMNRNDHYKRPYGRMSHPYNQSQQYKTLNRQYPRDYPDFLEDSHFSEIGHTKPYSRFWNETESEFEDLVLQRLRLIQKNVNELMCTESRIVGEGLFPSRVADAVERERSRSAIQNQEQAQKDQISANFNKRKSPNENEEELGALSANKRSKISQRSLQSSRRKKRKNFQSYSESPVDIKYIPLNKTPHAQVPDEINLQKGNIAHIAQKAMPKHSLKNEKQSDSIQKGKQIESAQKVKQTNNLEKNKQVNSIQENNQNEKLGVEAAPAKLNKAQVKRNLTTIQTSKQSSEKTDNQKLSTTNDKAANDKAIGAKKVSTVGVSGKSGIVKAK